MARHSFFCVDAHTCGNPVRVVAGGAPLLPHLPMAEKREIFQRDHDWVRRALMFEPRGHDVMSGSILYPSTRADCDVGVLFIEVSGCLPMCGHGTIGTVTAAIEEGLVVPREPGRLAIEAPAGRIAVEYVQQGQYVEQVRLFNVASYLHAADVEIEVPGLGALTIDVAYGGNFYAIIEPQAGWAGLDAMPAAELVRHSPAVRRAAQDKLAPVHPEDSRIRGVSHIMWCDAAARPAGAGPQRGVLRRQGDRPFAVRHRVFCPHGPVGRQGPAAGRPGFRARERYRHDVRLPGGGGGAGRQPTRPSCQAWPAGPGSPATTRSTSTTATPWRTDSN